MNLHCHNERNVFLMWIHSEFDDKRDQVWSKHVLPSVLIKYRAVTGKFCLNSWTFNTNPSFLFMWPCWGHNVNPADLNQQVAQLGHDLSSVFEALSLGSGWTLCTKENIVLTQTLQILLISPNHLCHVCWSRKTSPTW